MPSSLNVILALPQRVKSRRDYAGLGQHQTAFHADLDGCVQARGLRARVKTLEGQGRNQDEQLAVLRRASVGDEGDPTLAASWPAAARSSISALESQASNLRQRLAEREAKILSLEEAVLRLQAQLAPAAAAGAPTDRQTHAPTARASVAAADGVATLKRQSQK